MPLFTIGLIQFDDITPSFTTTDTVGNSVTGDTFTVSSSAQPITVVLEDDDTEFDDGFIDPPNNSTSGNNQLVAEPVTINGVDYGPAVAGGTPQDQIELEFAFTTTDGDTFFVVRIDGVNVGLSGPTLPAPGLTFTVDAPSDGEDEPFADLPCFCEGTEIETPNGSVPVEALVVGDLVTTLDSGPQPIVRVASRAVSVAEQLSDPSLRPVLFHAGAFGNERDLLVSQQHRVLVSGWSAEINFGCDQVLVPAKALVNDETIKIAPPDAARRYFHLLFADHQLVRSNGILTESLFPGADGAFPDGVREYHKLFGAEATARPVIRTRDARVLAADFL
ncbi:MAG: Hint domain-containing protein [Pseudomonadota bacterium]